MASKTAVPGGRWMGRSGGIVRLGVAGCGHWGPNHVRVFSSLRGASVVKACDPSRQRLEQMKRVFRDVKFTDDYTELLADDGLDAVVIATPTETHFRLAKEALLAGKDVLIEKPLAVRSAECEELEKLADSLRRILFVGFVFLYNEAIVRLRGYIRGSECGRVYYLHSRRTNLGPIRNDVSVVPDLASHDIAIFNYLLDGDPVSVSATGACFIQKQIEDVAFITMLYPDSIVAHIHVSWLDPKKVREITVVGEKGMITWDDVSSMGPIKIYDGGKTTEPYYSNFGEFHLATRERGIRIPKFAVTEPLRRQDADFLDCVRRRRRPLTDARFASRVTRALESLQKSMKAGGRPVPYQG